MIGDGTQPSAGAKKLAEMIKDLGNNKYKVKLTKMDYSKDPPGKEEKWVEVDFDGSLKKGDPGPFQRELKEKDGKTLLDKDYVIKHFWPLLIQRAYLKLYKKPYSCGGRVLPEGEDNTGSISNAMRSVTGKDPKYTDLRKDKSTDKGDSWKKIKDAHEAGKIVVLETNRCPIEDCGHTDEFHTKTNKLYKCHCYAVLGIKKDENGNEKLILFNPHNRPGDNPIELTKEEFEKGVRGFGVSR